MPLLVREIDEVDGASVEEWQLVERFPDPRLDALETVEAARAGDRTRATSRVRLANGVRAEFDADWSAVLRESEVLATIGAGMPAPSVLASARGRDDARRPRSPPARPVPTTSRSPRSTTLGAVLLVGRDGHPFRRRERQQLLALGRIADRIATLLH